MNKKIYINTLKIKNETIYFCTDIPDNVASLQAKLVFYNQQEKNLFKTLSYKVQANHLLFSFSISSLKLISGDWFLSLYNPVSNNFYTVILSRKLRFQLILGNYFIRKNDFIFFPMGSEQHKLIFRCRTATQYDNLSTRLKEFVSFGLYKLSRPLWKKKKIWLVFEKYCMTAQDNGFYFFRYCMEKLPPDMHKHVYFILDKNSEQWPVLQKYQKQVIPFMSFRHIFYMLIADLYIASDARTHAYIWKPIPNLLSREINRHDIFFLQHGVTALKRVDHIFGKNGFTPMTYFAVTSHAEQNIVIENFGYDKEHAPVVGFTRWDVLENKADINNKKILIMPTWRSWLEDKNDDFFCKSTYYKTYMSLLQNQELISFLKESRTKMIFYIHPKLREFIKNFHTPCPQIELIPFGKRPLNQLIMECSMLITDYSSVCWDVYYLGKPVLFYQFDLELYEETNGSYIDMKHDLFGDRCTEEKQLIALIKEYTKNNFKEKTIYSNMRKEYFSYHDQNNGKRTYDYIKKQGY